MGQVLRHPGAPPCGRGRRIELVSRWIRPRVPGPEPPAERGPAHLTQDAQYDRLVTKALSMSSRDGEDWHGGSIATIHTNGATNLRAFPARGAARCSIRAAFPPLRGAVRRDAAR